ncbi:MAG: hypothetical protein KF799_03790 [Bdellovibrionales bacterium]|nr:hypothetical protein [Bdellovibrionales bacterium]
MKWWLGLLLILFSCPLFAQPMCARGNVTLRKGPGTQHAVSWKVSKNMPFLRLERKKGWLKLQDLEGEVHWARASDLTSKTRCVVVKTNVAALHKEPSQNSPATDLKTLDRYTPLRRLDDNREWLQVEDEAGRKAWIHESQVWKPVVVNSFSF